MLATDAAANTVTVGTRAELEKRSVRVRDAVLHRDGAPSTAVKPALPLPRPAGHRLGGGDGTASSLDVELGEAFAGASPGQTAVLLAGERIVGHGTIAD